MKSLIRGLDILGAIATAPRKDFATLAASTRIPRSSLYRFLGVLEARGFVRQEPGTGHYAPGAQLYHLASSAGWFEELRQAARAVMPSLVHRTGESIYLYAREGEARVCVEALESPYGAIKHSIRPGSVFPLGAGASGKVILAFLPAEEQTRLLAAMRLPRIGQQSTLRRGRLREELASIQQRGYAYSEEELSPGAWAVAVPIHDDAGDCVASLGVAGPLVRLKRGRIKDYARLLQSTVNALRTKPRWHRAARA